MSVEVADPLLKVPEVAEILRRSIAGTYPLLNSGAIKSRKIGGARVVKRSDLEAYIASLPEDSTFPAPGRWRDDPEATGPDSPGVPSDPGGGGGGTGPGRDSAIEPPPAEDAA